MFSFETFQNIWRQQGQKKAESYRDSFKTPKTSDLSNETIAEDTTQAEVVENPSDEVEIETKSEEVEKTDTVEFTREDLEKKLNDAGVKFSHLAKDETLLKKCIENNLI